MLERTDKLHQQRKYQGQQNQGQPHQWTAVEVARNLAMGRGQWTVADTFIANHFKSCKC